MLIVYGGLLGLTYSGFMNTPAGFIPSQDMGYLLVNVQLPDSASAERTKAVLDKIEQIARKTPGVKYTQSIAGQSLLLSAYGSNFGSMFIILDAFAKRHEPELYGEAIAAKLRKQFADAGPRGDADGLRAAAGPRRRPGRRLQADGRGPRRLGAGDAPGPDREPGRRGHGPTDPPGPPRLVGLSSVFRANSRSCSSTSTAPRP